MARTACIVVLGLLATACGTGDRGDAEGVRGQVRVDGSSTVYPVAEAVAEEFQRANPRVRITVGISGTGGGLQRFCSGEIDVANASRPMDESERERCERAGVDFLELSAAWDGLSVVTHPSNDFVRCLTLDELREIWRPGSPVETWQDIRSSWPTRSLELFGPGVDSGTFDYFTRRVVGQPGASRTDFQASEDDNVLVEGVAGDRGSLGYFGYAYYVENRERLRLLGVDVGGGCRRPSDATIEDESYPLARPLYVYVNTASLQEDSALRAYMDYFMSHAAELVPPTGYHPLSAERYAQNLRAIAEAGSGP